MAKFDSLDAFYGSLDEKPRDAITRFVQHIATSNPELELVLAWNQPMFKKGRHYVVGFMPTAKHINLLTLTNDAVTHFAGELRGYRCGTRSISLPFDWNIDDDLLSRIVNFQVMNLPEDAGHTRSAR